MELKKQKNKNQETDGYETDKRPRTEKLKRKEITLTEKLEKKTETEKKLKQPLCSYFSSPILIACRIVSSPHGVLRHAW